MTKSINSRLRFSNSREESNGDSSPLIDPKKDVNVYETLCKYCSDNDLSLIDVTDFEFNEAVETIESYSINSDFKFYFWIDRG